MPLRLTDLAKSERAVTFPFEGESVTVFYRPMLLTPIMRLRLIVGPRQHLDNVEAATPEELLGAVNTYLDDLASLLVRWDVLGDDGEPLPPTPELLGSLPERFMEALLLAVVRDVSADPQNGEVSPATSPATG